MIKLFQKGLKDELNCFTLHFWRQFLIEVEFFNNHIVVEIKRIFDRLSNSVRHFAPQKERFVHVLDLKDKPSVQ